MYVQVCLFVHFCSMFIYKNGILYCVELKWMREGAPSHSDLEGNLSTFQHQYGIYYKYIQYSLYYAKYTFLLCTNYYELFN